MFRLENVAAAQSNCHRLRGSRRDDAPFPNFPVPAKSGQTQAMSIRLYTYEKCDTCRRAVKWLAARGVKPQIIPIRESPPSVAELRTMLGYIGDLRRLFNTSGKDYKAMNLKDRLPKLTEDEALALLAKNGNLVKRPFALAAKSGAVGFKEEEWKRMLRPA